jgi:hypothetical protein
MMTGQPLDVIPMWALYFLTVLALLATMEVGYRLTKARQRKSPDETDAGVGSMSGASLALLAFLLAFVVGFASNIAAERRQLVMAEANAIGTTYLRAGYLDEAYRTQARDLLREYTDICAWSRRWTQSSAPRPSPSHSPGQKRSTTSCGRAPR